MKVQHLQEIGADILKQDLVTDQETTSGAQGSRFQGLCHDFREGDELYIHYRGCRPTHTPVSECPISTSPSVTTAA